MDLYLAELSCDEGGRTAPLALGGRLILGRSPHADFVVKSPYANRQHCEVRRDAAGVWVTDLDSRSGTYLNGRKLRRHAEAPLRPGDDLRLAEVRFGLFVLDLAWLSWRDGTVIKMAKAAYEQRLMPSVELDPALLAVLADALEESGCDNQEMLTHLRGPGPHVRGCWVVDLLLGKS
jgi:predicted component of type VI protein secretion system